MWLCVFRAMSLIDPIMPVRAAFNQGENAKYDFQVTGGVQHRHSSHAVPEQSVIGSFCATATSDGGETNRGKTRE